MVSLQKGGELSLAEGLRVPPTREAGAMTGAANSRTPWHLLRKESEHCGGLPSLGVQSAAWLSGTPDCSVFTSGSQRF